MACRWPCPRQARPVCIEGANSRLEWYPQLHGRCCFARDETSANHHQAYAIRQDEPVLRDCTFPQRVSGEPKTPTTSGRMAVGKSHRLGPDTRSMYRTPSRSTIYPLKHLGDGSTPTVLPTRAAVARLRCRVMVVVSKAGRAALGGSPNTWPKPSGRRSDRRSIQRTSALWQVLV